MEKKNLSHIWGWVIIIAVVLGLLFYVLKNSQEEKADSSQSDSTQDIDWSEVFSEEAMAKSALEREENMHSDMVYDEEGNFQFLDIPGRKYLERSGFEFLYSGHYYSLYPTELEYTLSGGDKIRYFVEYAYDKEGNKIYNEPGYVLYSCGEDIYSIDIDKMDENSDSVMEILYGDCKRYP